MRLHHLLTNKKLIFIIGYFAYTEASAPRNSFDTAFLAGPTLPASQGKCWIKFWYNMYGRFMGRLQVVLMDAKLNQTLGTIWQKSGNQGCLVQRN